MVFDKEGESFGTPVAAGSATLCNTSGAPSVPPPPPPVSVQQSLRRNDPAQLRCPNFSITSPNNKGPMRQDLARIHQ